MSSSSVWVQLYYEGMDQPKGQPIKIKPAPEDVAELIEAVQAKLKLHAPLNEIYACLPGTTPPFSEANAVDPGDDVPPGTTSKNPLIVVAPQLQPAGGEYTLGPPQQKQQQQQVYVMNFVVKGASQSKGARGNVYKTIQDFQGHYSKSEGIRIDYDGANLRAKTYFRVYENACLFGNALNDWEIHKELLHLQGVEFESFTPTEVDNPGDLERVMLQHYDPSSTESPIYSLNQLHTYRFSNPETEAVDSASPLAQYQCLDKQVVGYNPYKCHLKDKAKFKDYRNDENNMVAASWQLHQQLDGLNSTEGIPGVIMTISSTATDRSADHENRTAVSLNLEFHNEYLASLFQGNRMPKKIDERNWQITVFVKDPKIFGECVAWKANDTRQQWDAHARFLASE